MGCERIFGMRCFFSVPSKQRIQAKSGSSSIESSAGSYQNYVCFVVHHRSRVSPRRASYLSCSHKKRNPKNATRLSASRRLRLWANLRHTIQSAVRQNSLCATRAAQTHCRKLDVEALALFGANARSPNRVPQAQTHGWKRVRTACQSCDEIGFKPNF